MTTSVRWLARILQAVPLPKSKFRRSASACVETCLTDAGMELANGHRFVPGQIVDAKSGRFVPQTGQEIMQDLLDALEPGRAYLLGLKNGEDGAPRQEDTVGLVLHDGSVQFMDPKVRGEVTFSLRTPAEVDRFTNFVGRLYDILVPFGGTDLWFGEVQAAAVTVV